MEDPNTFCAGSGVLHQFNHRRWEPRVICAAHLSLSSSFLHPAAFVLPIPLSPIKAELNLLRGPNRCVLFLQQFEMITQLWCLSVTSCDDRHCNRAGEIVFFHSSTPPPPPDSLPFSPLPPPPPLPPPQSSHSRYLSPADGMGVHVRLKTPHYQPPLCQAPTPSHHPCCLMDKHTFKMGKRGEHDRHVALET